MLFWLFVVTWTGAETVLVLDLMSGWGRVACGVTLILAGLFVIFTYRRDAIYWKNRAIGWRERFMARFPHDDNGRAE